VRAAEVSPFDSHVQSSGSDEDPLIAALDLAGLRSTTSGFVRLVRAAPSADDSTWAREAGHVLIHWPATTASASLPKRGRVDTVGAVAAGSALVGRFPRFWSLDATGGRPVARWIDGEPAAVERITGGGCVREVAVALDPASDLTLRPAFRAFVERLVLPCGGTRAPVPVARAVRDSLAGAGPLVSASALRDPHERASAWTSWLFGAAALLLIIELGMRRQRSIAV
jgi:hypothetical protein